MSPPFSIKWDAKFSRIESGVTFDSTQSLGNSLDNHSSINNSRNCQEIPEAIGKIICDMIDTEISKESEVMRLQAEAKVQPNLLIEPDDWDAFSREISKYGKIQFLSPYGSRFYNLHTPTSDIDMCGIFVADIDQWLGVQKPLITVKNPNNTKPDYVLHEVSHYVKLVASGDPRMIELLFAHPSVVVSHTIKWDELTTHKQSFVCLDMAKKYLSEIDGSKGISLVKAMIQKQPNNPDIAKKWYIIFRLLLLATRTFKDPFCPYFQNDGTVSVEEFGEDFSSLMNIRANSHPAFNSHDKLLDLYCRVRSQVEQSITATASRTVPINLLSEWVISLKLTHFNVQHGDLAAYSLASSPPTHFIELLPPSSSLICIAEVNSSLVGVYCSETKSTLDPFCQDPITVRGTIKDTNQSYTFYEIITFCTMLQNGNPNMLELVANNSTVVSSEAWKVLVESKQQVITVGAIERCLANLKFHEKNKKKKPTHNSGEQLVDVYVQEICSKVGVVVPTSLEEKLKLLEQNKGLFTAQEVANNFINDWLVGVRKAKYLSHRSLIDIVK